MKTFGINLIVASTLSLFLAACGGSDSATSKSTSVSDIKIGTFVDAPVQGLMYSTSSQSGVTDVNGNFKYMNGEMITFKIGNLVLGKVNAKKTITPLTLGGDNDLNTIGLKAVNIARILQSLDDNPTNNDVIVIPSSLEDLDVPNIDLESDADLQTILTLAQFKTSKMYSLKSSIDAKNDMKIFLRTYLYVGDYTATSNYSSSSTLSLASCGGILKWIIEIDKNGILKGSSTSEGNRLIAGISITDSIIKGSANDGTVWNLKINEDGVIDGRYDWNNGECVGTISGTKN